MVFAIRAYSNMAKSITSNHRCRKPLSTRLASKQFKYDSLRRGFSLVELLVAAAAGLIILGAAGSAIINQIQTVANAARIEKLRASWAKAIKFIETEVNLSERIYTDSAAIQIPLQCSEAQSGGFQFKMALDVGRSLPLVIYGIKTSPLSLANDNVLWRCGPRIESDGSYGSTYSQGILTDGLDNSSTSKGFEATRDDPSNLKNANFSLSFKNDSGSIFRLSANSSSRISPLFISLRDTSSCILADNFATLGSTVALSSPGLGCGIGTGSNTLTGTAGNDTLEAGAGATSSTIIGGAGNDYLRGTNGPDTLSGGDGDDVLIGRAGNDTMTGGNGNNQYLPGTGTNTVVGSSTGTDIVYLDGNRSGYTISSPCRRTSCTISKSGESHTLTDVDTIIFPDGRIDLE